MSPPRRHSYSTTLSWGGDEPTAEIEVEVSFTVAWGSSGTPTPYYGPPENYDPGSPDTVEDVRILKVNGKPWPVDLSYGFQTPAQDHEMIVDKLDSLHDDMIESALGDLAYDRDEAADYKYRSQRERDW